MKKTRKKDCLYQPLYCEENIWQLLMSGRIDPGESYAVVITNSRQHILLWRQTICWAEDGHAGWDYHVILVNRSRGQSLVYDFDTTLSFPVDFPVYLKEVVKPVEQCSSIFFPKFRVIPGVEYRDGFWSNRSYKAKPTGKFIDPPPEWPKIKSKKPTVKLRDALDLENKKIGQIMNLEEFANHFTH